MLRCPSCELAHFPTEVCGRDSERGLAYNGKLELARSALEAAPVEAKAKGKGGRPKAPGLIPWKERNRDHLKAYKRAYMRDYMRARRARTQV
jgi:hypothetical protein